MFWCYKIAWDSCYAVNVCYLQWLILEPALCTFSLVLDHIKER